MDIPLQTTSSACISTSGPAVNSPSDLSYSSGPSHTSTRNTSPDPASSGALSRHSSPFVDLSLATGSIDYTPNILLHQSLTMDKNSFQSVNDRRNKILQVARPSIQAPPGHHRSLTSANWRAQTPEDAVVPQSRNMYHPFDTPATSYHLQHPPIRTTPFPNTRVDQHHHLQHAATITSYPSPGPISEAQLDGSFAYCYDRGNGQYTRLIPADMLPPLQSIPAVQQGYAGMVVVPQPRGLPPSGHSSNTEPVAVRSPTATPTSPADTIQSRIDNIVAATPSTPTHLSPGSSNNPPPGHRRPKIYCDKWVHEGVCAFTQQGCKYKHEMPSDKVTQHQLGLFHGYPQWWKKHQADLARQRDVLPPEGPKNGSQNNASRPNNEQYLGQTNSLAVGNGGARGGALGLTSDTAGQLAWRSSGELQALGPPPSMGRATVSRGMSGTMRNTMASSSPDNNLSPCPISYGSPFGPIAPPIRSNATVNILTESVRGSSVAQSIVEPHTTSQGTRRSSPAGTGITTSSMLPTSNPYASLDTLDNNSDQNTKEGFSYTETSRQGGIHLS